jgi:5-dehydro-2-deoxygluconokinase
VGRTIFHEPSHAWLAGEIGDDELIARVRHTFETLIASWRATRGASAAQAGAPNHVHQEQAA